MQLLDRAEPGRQLLTRAPGDEWPLLVRVMEAADAVERGDSANDLLHALVAATADGGTPTRRLCRIFTRSLLARLRGEGAGLGNLYADDADPGAMLAAFQVLVESTPMVRFGYTAANEAILAAAASSGAVHVVDVGMGAGTQWEPFLDALAARLPGTRLRLTGIDVPAPAPEAPDARLRAAGDRLAARAEALGIPFRFHAVAAPVQEVDFAALHDGSRGETLAVNAAFALHHLPDPERGAVLDRIAALRPHVLSLVEPEVNHNHLPLGARVRESLSHYYPVFDALASLLPGRAERATLEGAFFGREIVNVVVGEGAERVERHERFDAWRRRLEQHGFRPRDLRPFRERVAHQIGARRPVAIQERDACITLQWKGAPLVAASAWAW